MFVIHHNNRGFSIVWLTPSLPVFNLSFELVSKGTSRDKTKVLFYWTLQASPWAQRGSETDEWDRMLIKRGNEV